MWDWQYNQVAANAEAAGLDVSEHTLIKLEVIMRNFRITKDETEVDRRHNTQDPYYRDHPAYESFRDAVIKKAQGFPRAVIDTDCFINQGGECYASLSDQKTGKFIVGFLAETR